MAISGISNALSAIQRQQSAVDRASEKVTRAASTDVTQTPATQQEADEVSSQHSALVTGTVEMMVARRMFTAALKMAAAANEGISDALRLGNYDAAA